MSSLSPGDDDGPSTFAHVLPGAPNAGLQTITTLTFRWKRYVVYISGQQLNILRSPTELVQAVHFDDEDAELVAVRAEGGDSGKLAVASPRRVWILQPKPTAWGQVAWVRELLLMPGSADDEARTLSWGADGELLVGGSRNLSLFGTLPSSRTSTPSTPVAGRPGHEERCAMWSQTLASPVREAEFSPTAGLIASSSVRDRLVKIWRRLSWEEGVFDFAYLPHEGLVTHLEWRTPDPETLEDESTTEQRVKSYHGPDEECEVLFTLSSDAKLRIWRTNGHNDLGILSLYTVVDLVSAIPHSPILTTNGDSHHLQPARYAFVLPSGAYIAAVATALKKQQVGQVSHSIEHLKEVSSKSPDVIVTLDGHGRMSAWGLSSVGHKRRPEEPSDATFQSPFHIAHTENMDLRFHEGVSASFETWFDGDVLNILAHSFGRSVSWWRGGIEQFSSPTDSTSERGRRIAEWTGSPRAIVGLRTTHDQENVLSWTGMGSIDEWSVGAIGELQPLKSAHVDDQILDADNVQRDKSLICVGTKGITLARVEDSKGSVGVKHALHESRSLRLMRMDDIGTDTDACYLIYDNRGRFRIASVNPTRREWQSTEPTVDLATEMGYFPLSGDSLGCRDSFVDVAAVDHPRKAGWLRLVGLTKDGLILRRDISSSTLHDSSNQHSEQVLAFSTESTGSLLLAANPDCAALVASHGADLSIVDLKEGYREHKQKLSGTAEHLQFSRGPQDDPMPTEHSVLAVGYAETVEILARSRYEHPHGSQPHRWTLIKRVSIAGTGFSISAIAWLGKGRLAVAGGNSFFVSDNTIMGKDLGVEDRQRLDISADDRTGIPELASRLKAAFSVWHPVFLRHLVLHGLFSAVVKILGRLEEKLRFHTQDDELSATLNMDINDLLDADFDPVSDGGDESFSELRDQLAKMDLPLTSDLDQERLKVVAKTVSYVQRHLQSLDANAIKYLFCWRYQVLLQSSGSDNKKPFGASTNGATSNHRAGGPETKFVPVMSWREIALAYHSSTQQPLLEILNSHYENKLDWHTVKSLGITSWLHNVKAAQSEGSSLASLEQLFDVLGQNAYRSSQPPDPVNASLFLLSLRKKPTLLALWRVAIGNREQKSTQNFLRRNFDAEENKTAARKNAYALLGKRRFEYAAAFFLLADDPDSAVRILAAQCEDVQLAVAVARLYCGDTSPVLRRLLHDRVLPAARQSGDRWLLSWASDIVGLRAEAARALVADIDDLVGESPSRTVRSWQQDDPAALALFRQLRDVEQRTAPATSGKALISSLVSAREEYRAVLRAARVLRRMGMWLLALELVSRWRFTLDVRTAPPVELLDVTEEGGSLNGAAHTDAGGVPDMLASFSDKTPPQAPSGDPAVEPKSLLGPTGPPEPAPQSTTPDSPSAGSEAQDRAAKAAEMMAKIRAKVEQKKQEQQNGDGKDAGADGEEKRKPTQFKEPASSSILDSFGF